jgi:hypothetical protein
MVRFMRSTCPFGTQAHQAGLPKDYDQWLGIDDRGGDPRPPFDLLYPYDAEMKMTLANPAVGNWRNNVPEMLDGPK